MAGRPPLRIGQHGKITRENLGSGMWVARCKYRDSDGVTRRVERRGPAGDKHGKLAEDALIDSLKNRRPPGAPDGINTDTLVKALMDRHLERLVELKRSPKTLSDYRYATRLFEPIIGKVRLGEVTPGRLDTALRAMQRAHGDGLTRHARNVLSGGLKLAVMATVIPGNPLREVSIERDVERDSKHAKGAKRKGGAKVLTGDQLRDMVNKLRGSAYCQKRDLVDPFLVFAATGLRRSEVMALQWEDYDPAAATLTVRAKVLRATGFPLQRIEDTKTEASQRTVPLPKFAIEALDARKGRAFLGEQTVIFPSTRGKLRDPDYVGTQWAKVRDDLGVPDVTSHSFRKTMATLIDEEGMSVRKAADQLGHARISVTQDIYQARKRVHHDVADMINRTVAGASDSDELSTDDDQGAEEK